MIWGGYPTSRDDDVFFAADLKVSQALLLSRFHYSFTHSILTDKDEIIILRLVLVTVIIYYSIL